MKEWNRKKQKNYAYLVSGREPGGDPQIPCTACSAQPQGRDVDQTGWVKIPRDRALLECESWPLDRGKFLRQRFQWRLSEFVPSSFETPSRFVLIAYPHWDTGQKLVDRPIFSYLCRHKCSRET